MNIKKHSSDTTINIECDITCNLSNNYTIKLSRVFRKLINEETIDIDFKKLMTTKYIQLLENALTHDQICYHVRGVVDIIYTNLKNIKEILYLK